MHVVQTRDPPRLNPQAPLQPQHLRGLSQIIFLEYLGRGSLHKLICEVQSRKTTFPNRLLWLIFQCCKCFLPSWV